MAEAFLTPLSLLATIVKTAPDALVVADDLGRVMFVNEQTERLFGFAPEELMGELVERLLPQDGDRRSDRSFRAEVAPMYAVAKDGRRVPVEVRTSSVPFHGGQLVAISLRDVSGRVRVEREMRQMREQLAHVGRVSALGELVSSVAHELNQPLAAILSNAQSAQHLLARDDPDLVEARETLEVIVAQNRRASEVISHLRSMVRRELRKPERLDLGGLLAEMGPLLERGAAERRIDLEIRVEEALPPVDGDSIQLQQALLNLVLNAFDAVEQGGQTTRRIVVEIRASSDDEDEVELEVRDTGTGLEAGRETAIFEPFVTSKAQGLGMGLSIVRTVVETHGGRVWAETNDAGGATFHVVLPAAD